MGAILLAGIVSGTQRGLVFSPDLVVTGHREASYPASPETILSAYLEKALVEDLPNPLLRLQPPRHEQVISRLRAFRELLRLYQGEVRSLRMDSCQVTVEHDRDCTVVHVRGEVDVATSSLLRDALLCEQEETSH